jgi:6-pyruvoyltetrahydropterin/6-carboxytetrahydropterin synthase
MYSNAKTRVGFWCKDKIKENKAHIFVSGKPDEVTGMVMNLADLNRIVNEVVIDKFDHKNLNLDTEEFKNINPTSDNMVKVVWDMLFPHLPNLSKIGLWETEKNYFEYCGPTHK